MAKDDPNTVAENEGENTEVKHLPTKVSKEEEEALIESFSKPLHELEDALEKQRQDEREVFKGLMAENAQLKRAKEKADEREEEVKTKYELLKIDLEAEVAKSKAKDDTISGMENDMRTLIVSKKSKGKGKKTKSGADEKDGEDVGNITTKYDNDEALPFSEKYTKQIKDLKFRLKKLADDEASKDRRIKTLETELDDTRELLVELQQHVDETKLEELREKIEERKKEKEVTYYDKKNIVTSKDGNHAKSAVCVIQ